MDNELLQSYFRMTLLNEVLFGLPRDYYDAQARKAGLRLHVDFQNVYICLTGLKKHVYTGEYGFDSTRYMEAVFLPCRARGREFIKAQGYSADIVLVTYNLDKQIAWLFSPGGRPSSGKRARCSAWDIAQTITDIYQEQYEKVMFQGRREHCNFTVLTPLLRSYDDIAPAFARLIKLSDMSFFTMKPMVMTDAMYWNRRRGVQPEAFLDLLGDIEEAVVSGQPERIESGCRELFRGMLRHSFSLRACREALYEIRKIARRYAMVYDIEFDDRRKRALDSHANIEALHAYCRDILLECAHASRGRGGSLSHVTVDAVRYVRTHFKEDISLQAVAAHAHVAPDYLCRKFSQDMGRGLFSYLRSLRMEHAKTLLARTSLRVSEIAREVGMQPKYFSAEFRKFAGFSPMAYRKSIRQGSIDKYTFE